MKKVWFTLVLVICVLMGSVGAYAGETYRLMVFGDSLSAGYRLKKNESFASQLQDALLEKGYTQVEIINESRSGETTGGGLRRQSAALKKKPNAVLLELGINDVLRGESIARITQNLSKLIENFQDDDIAVLLAGMKAPPITEPAYARQFEQMYQSLARKYRVKLYPFFMQAIFQNAGGSYEKAMPYLKADKAHPTSEGVSLMVADILPTVISFLNQQGVRPSDKNNIK